MSSKIEDTPIRRYLLPEVAEHLAANYAMGLLSVKVRKRLEKLRQQRHYKTLNEKIYYWENKLSPLNDSAPELAPLPESWEIIQQRLSMGKYTREQQAKRQYAWWNWGRFSMAFSLVLCIALGVSVMQPAPSMGSLSYVAVLESDANEPQVVASTYGDSKQLVLDILSLPDIDNEESYELWVTSKSDKQKRSLGLIPKNISNFNRQLSQAEWRLIADSSYLLISIEEEGGSALGEPSDMIVSKGLCIRLAPQEGQS